MGEQKGVESYAGGEKSGIAIQQPDEERWRRMQEAASSESLPSDHRTITLYQNGFVVDSGPFRPLSDPLNLKFMNEVTAGRCPRELENDGGSPVHVQVVDKRDEIYKESEGPRPMYGGAGESLSSDAGSSSVAVCAEAGSVQVDESKPKTKIQIRFHNGSKKAQEFNQDQTVGDLRAFCSQCISGQSVKILDGFPPKPLTDDSMTLKDAGLINAQVTVKPA